MVMSELLPLGNDLLCLSSASVPTRLHHPSCDLAVAVLVAVFRPNLGEASVGEIDLLVEVPALI